ncbi:hypothetical protein R5R35_000697 [Gryllus longicercus]|uniref:Thioredoxin domain-containing protein n=1 Tax=Gryllus longicercus TaxID=2509291 RepID=A0AAN9VSG6_9ORTH|nr:uncharacterized protein GBIM_13274 [Gryllus bimaculatus]
MKMYSRVLKVVLILLIALFNEGLSSEDIISSIVPTDNPFGYGISGVENKSPSSNNILVSGDAKDLNSKDDRELSIEDNDQTLEGEVVSATDHLEETFGTEDSLNNSSINSSNSTDIAEEKGNITSIVACNTEKENGGQPVELVNSTRLVSILITESNVTDRRTNADCALVLFYARYCPFSSMAAPHFNALPRAFPDIKLAAVDAMKYHSFNTQYGIVGVPTLMLFHNGRPAAKFNDSEYNLEAFAKFITKYTGLQPHDKLYVTSADFGGPVSSVPTKETDYCLILSWAFMFVCGLYFFSKSSWWRWISEAIQNTWREAEAQHEHGD